MIRIVGIVLIILGAAIMVNGDPDIRSGVSGALFERYNPNAAELRNFNSTRELMTFLTIDQTNLEALRYDESNNNCVHISLKLQERARRSGYIMNVLVISPEEYYRLFGKRLSTNHMICSTLIENSIYYIEPQTNQVVWVTRVK